ncbi:uncharacterized protein LOC117299230 isoform X2 [Asterias rubens]|nr:uncharacterized protein LOC117299230 isoform X2 [Asterias rubens]
MPEDDIIMSEVAILTGGRDQYGRPIITFPAKYHGILESKVKASGMDILLRYYIDITRPKDRQRGFAFVTDLRFSVLDFIIFMKSTLNSLQAEMNGVIGTCVLYVILPLNKKTHKDAMTHLSLRDSKKKTNKNIVPPFFQSVGVDDEMELYNYIEKSHLTTELGGYLQYSHQDWVVFRRVVEPFFTAFETFQTKLSHAFHRLSTMMNINGGNTKGELQQTLNIVQDEYNDIRRELNLDPVFDECEEILRRFTCCEEEDVFTVLAQKPVFKETKDAVESCYRVLTSAKKKIEDDWNELSGGIVQAMQHVDYTTNVNKLLEWFKFKKERDLKQQAVIADKLSDAELMYNHFETGLLPKAKEKLDKATDLILLGERMSVDFNNHRVRHIVTLNQTLKDQSDEFQTLVKKRHQILQSVYHFHQLYNKARRWYIKCLRFLPSELSDLYNELRSHSQDDHLGASQLQWEEDVRRFLHKSPLLAKEELKKVKLISEQIGDVGLKKKGRLLSYRCSILTSFLSHKNKTTSANIVDMLKWRSELLNQADDSASCQSETLPSRGHIKKAQSESSLDSAEQSQRPRKASSKRQTKNASKNHKKKLDRDEPLHRSSQSLSRVKRDQRNDRHSDANGDTMGDSDTDDPLIRRLGQAGEVYNRHGDRQGQGLDEIDHGESKAQKTQRNKQISGTRKREIPNIRQLEASRLARSQSVPLNNSSSMQQEQAQTYGIYGDVDVDDDTAVVIQVPLNSSQSLPLSPVAHQDGPSFPSRILPGSPSVAHQQGPSYPTQTPPVDSSSTSLYHQVPPHPSQGLRVNVSSSGNQHQGWFHQPQDILVERLPENYVPHQQRPDWNSGGQHVPLTMDPSNITLGSHRPSYGVVQQVITPSNQYSRTQHSNVMTQKRQQGPFHQHDFPNENPNIRASPNFNSNNSYTQSPSPLAGQYVTDAKQGPISFHGSLMNIHQPQGGSPLIRQNAQTQHVIGSSPVTRHQSLMNLSPSPQFDGRNPQYIRIQGAAGHPDPSHFTYLPHNNEPHISSLSPVHSSSPNSRSNTMSNLRHGYSEPNLSSMGYEQPPTYDIPGHHASFSQPTNAAVQSRLPHQYSNHGSLSSRHPLSRSEVDLRHIPENLTQFSSLPRGLSHSNQSLHRSDPELRHFLPARSSVHSPNQNGGYSPTQYLSTSGEDPELEYYKKLSSSSPQLNLTTSASGRRSTNHTLDPAVHTWMHDVPSTITESFLESRPGGRRLLSPLKILELEVANETLDAEDAILEDDYEKQQLRRHAVINSIIQRSDLGIRSQDKRLSNPRSRHPERQRSMSNPRLDSVRSPSRRAARNLQMSPVSSTRRERHSDLYHDTRSSPLIPRVYQSRQVPLSHTGRSYNTQKGSLVNENDWRQQHLRDLGLSSQEASPAIVNGSLLHSPAQLANRTERDFGLSSTLPQFSGHEQNPRSFPTSYNETNQRLNDLYELGIIPPNDYRDLEISRSSPYPSNPSLRNFSTLSKDQSPGQDTDNNWRLEHLRELGISPHQANSRNTESVYPESTYQSSSSSYWRYEDRQELGIPGSAIRFSNGGSHRSQYLNDVQTSPAYHHPVNQSTALGRAVLSNGSVPSDTNWQQNHLQELGLSPGYTDSFQSNNVPLGKPAIRISGIDEQRKPQPTDAGLYPSSHQSERINSQGPSTRQNRNSGIRSNKRQGNLEDTAVSPIQHAARSEPAGMYHSDRNNIQAHSTPQNRNLGRQSIRRQDTQQDAGVSPGQRATPRPVTEPSDHNGVLQRTQTPDVGPSHSVHRSQKSNTQAYDTPQNRNLDIQSNRRPDTPQDAVTSARQRATLSEPADLYQNGVVQRPQQITQAHISPSTDSISSSNRHSGIQSNRRQDNPQDAGVPARQRATLSEPAPAYQNGVAQRTNQQSQPHLSPTTHHQSSQQNDVSDRRAPLVGQVESDPDWRANYLRELGISPTMQQYANRSQYNLADVAPVTSRLQGAIASGRSTNNMEEVYELDEDTRKKSVRFAKVSDESILDEEEKAQEEVALRLQQLELQLQEEETRLMHDDISRKQQTGRPQQEARVVPPQQPSTHRQLQRHSNQPDTQNQVSYETPGYRRQTETGIQQPLNSQQSTRPTNVDNPSISSMQSGNNTSSFYKPSSIASKSDVQYGEPGPIRAQEGSLSTKKTVTPAKVNLNKSDVQYGEPGPIRAQEGSLGTTKTVSPGSSSYSRPSLFSSSADAATTKGQEVIKDRRTDNAENHVVKSRNLQNQSTGFNIDSLDRRQSHENIHHSLPVNETQVSNSGSVEQRNALSLKVKPSDENYVGTVHHRADREPSHESIAPSARLQNSNLNTNPESIDRKNSLQAVDKSKDIMSEVLGNDSGMPLQTANVPSPASTAVSDDSFARREHQILPSQERTLESVPKMRPFKRQVSIGGRDQKMVEAAERRPSSVDMVSENQVPVVNDSQSMYQPSEPVGDPSDYESELYQTEGYISSRPQLDRDHTAADYIACALGLDYVSDKMDLTVQPRSNSSEQLNSYNQDDGYSNESLLGDLPPRRAQQNVDQVLDSSQNPDRGHERRTRSDGQEVPHVTLPGSRDGLEEGPCSPIRQWLKEKEINEAKDGIPRHKTWDEPKPGYSASPAEHKVGEASGNQEAGKPANKSQSSSPIRQWLREEQNKEEPESTVMDRDPYHTGSSSFVVDASTGKISELKANKFGYKGTRRDSEKSLLNQRERSHSSSPSLLSPDTTSGTKSREQRRRSSSAIPVYKGPTKSSPPKTKVPFLRRRSDTLDMSPADASELMRKRAADSKKESKYSKIPVPKVFKALQDGGFLGTETSKSDKRSKSDKGSLPRQVSALKKSNQAVDHSTPAQKEEARPGFERQGTFTKEERPPFNKEGTFTIESEDVKDTKQTQKVSFDANTSSNAKEASPKESSFSPLGLVLDHIVKKGNVSKSKKATMQTPDGKKRHDSQEEIFENSSTESSMSPTSKSTTIISRKPTSNLYNTKHYHINVHGAGSGSQDRASRPEVKDAEGEVGSYAGLAESDRLEHDDLGENDLEKMIMMKSQLAEIRNLEIENRHLAYERKEFEAHYLKNMHEHEAEVAAHSDEEG